MKQEILMNSKFISKNLKLSYIFIKQYRYFAITDNFEGIVDIHTCMSKSAENRIYYENNVEINIAPPLFMELVTLPQNLKIGSTLFMVIRH